MRQYFIHDGLNENGPFDFEQLKLQPLKSDTPIWFEGLEHWTTVSQVDELKTLLISKPTPPPINAIIDQPKNKPPKIGKNNLDESAISELEPTKKKSMILTFILAFTVAIVLFIFIIWLVYQNKKQEETLHEVQQKVISQEQTLTDQKNAEDEKKRINEAITAKNMNYRNNWNKYIRVGRSSYTFSTLGGIDEFTVKVYNDTEYMLDEVVVNVTYIKTSGDTYKTESVVINNIPANSFKTGTAPSSSRGTSVDVNIAGVVSKKMHFCYPYENGNSEDPHFCK
jgi:GYF domain 2